METIHCPYCKCTDDLECIIHYDDWVDDETMTSVHDMRCCKCNKTFTLSETLNVKCREYVSDDEVIEKEEDE